MHNAVIGASLLRLTSYACTSEQRIDKLIAKLLTTSSRLGIKLKTGSPRDTIAFSERPTLRGACLSKASAEQVSLKAKEIHFLIEQGRSTSDETRISSCAGFWRMLSLSGKNLAGRGQKLQQGASVF